MTKIMNNFTDPPVLRLKYGHAVKARHIREGSDVYFECQVTSNPPITVGRLHWFRGVSKLFDIFDTDLINCFCNFGPNCLTYSI